VGDFLLRIDMSEFKKFKSSTDKEIRLANILGYSVVIGKEFIPVHSSLWGLAYGEGCIPEDARSNNTKEVLKANLEFQEEQKQKEKKEYKEVLRKIYESPNGFVNKSGDLILRNVMPKFGKPLKTDFIYEIWDELIAENSQE
jgi:hypothetical protein